MEKGALVLEGGSLRGMFTAGVLDVLMENGIWMEYVNGVSAGSMCGYNYISRQPGRTRQIDETFGSDRKFMGLRNLLLTLFLVGLSRLLSSLLLFILLDFTY